MTISCGSSVSPRSTEAPTGLTAEQVARVDEAIAEEVSAEGFPSLAVGIVKDGRLVWHRGYGSRASSGAVDADTVFRIGSVTKLFTAVAIVQLRDAGKLRLDDPAARFLPEVAGALSPTGSSPVTVLHLLTHASGVPSLGDGSLDWTTGRGDITEADLLAAVRDVELAFSPGSRFQYSNVGMALAGLIVARASGQAYRAYVDEHILRPLGMRSTFWDRASIPAERLAEGHRRGPSGGYEPGGPHWRLGAIEPAGGLYSTVEDMARFAAFALGREDRAPAGAAGPLVLKAESLREMQRPVLASSESLRHGMGWVIEQHPGLGPVVWHNGSTGDHGAWLGVVPDRGIAFVGLLGTGEPADVDQLESLGKDVLESLVTDPTNRAARTTPKEAMDAVMTRLMKLLAEPGEPLVRETFSPEFLAEQPAPAIASFFESVRGQTGACQDYTIKRDRGDGVFRAHIRCASMNLNADVTARVAPPHLIDRILVRPAN